MGLYIPNQTCCLVSLNYCLNYINHYNDLDIVNNSLEWKKLSVTNLGCNVPYCKEIAIGIWDDFDNIQIEKVIPYNHLNFSASEGIVIVVGGWFFSTTNFGVCSIQLKPTNYIELYSFVVNGVERKSNSKMDILYR